MSAREPAKTIPRMVGRFHLLEEMGRGTFGPLHLARFEGPNGFQRWSQVLEVESRFSRDAEFRQGFFESARTAARIQHPNVEATLDVGETEGMLWLAVEHVLAETAKDLLTVAQTSRTPVPWDIVCRMMSDAALGLDAIHELSHATTGEPMKLVHGRLSPHRIAVTYDGATKVLEPSAPFASLGESGKMATAVGRAVAYAAPEMLRGEMFDRRSDVFSLGVICWELSAGRRLFGGTNESETRAKIQANVIPPLAESVLGFPAEVEAIIRQALSPDPAQRIPTAKLLARALREVLVKGGLVVGDEDVARYLLQIFPDRLAQKKDKLLTAADVTHVFQRDSLAFDSMGTGPTPVLSIDPPTIDNVTIPVRLVATPRASRPPTATRPMLPTTLSGPPPVPMVLFAVLGGVALAVVAVLLLVLLRSRASPPPVASVTPSSSPAVPVATSAPAPPPPPPPPPAPSASASAAPSESASAKASVPTASVRPAPAPPPAPAAAPAKGRVTVICDPACDDVLDGKVSLGPTPIFRRPLAAGNHRITLRITDPPVQKIVEVTVVEGDVTVVKQSMP